jgi:serine/threonine-protein kinase
MAQEPRNDSPEDSLAVTIDRPTAREPHVESLHDTIDSRSLDLPLRGAPVPSLIPGTFEERYEAGEVVGQGGMGVVRLCRDRRIGRSIAMKVLRSGHETHSEAQARFLREARVQGQLEHPGIVPVHELGTLADGTTYFTMKRVAGRTLEEVLQALRRSDPEVKTTYTRHKLLTAFSNVCMSVAFAHSRGVVHRDLKPANVMLGAFGEVHVLDWGIAKIHGAPDLPTGRASAAPPRPARNIDTGDSKDSTREGEILGTPGYMPPEQVQGRADLDARADVYALGAILFEILSLEPLHRGETVDDVLFETLGGVDARPSQRRPDLGIPPELDRICARATAQDAAQRYATPQRMAEELDRFLEGDRDVELRKEIALRHVGSARRLLGSARGDQAYVARAQAIRELSTALALDPTNETAATQMVQALGESLDDLPPPAMAEYEEALQKTRQSTSKQTAAAYFSGFLLYAYFLFVEVRSQLALYFALGTLAVVAVYSATWSPRSRWTRSEQIIAYILAVLAFSATSCFFGPLIAMPTFAAITLLVFFAQVRLARGEQYVCLTLTVIAVALPPILQALDYLPTTYELRDGLVVIHPWLTTEFTKTSLFVLWLASLQLIVISGILVGRAVELLVNAERRLFAHAWNLRHLVPGAAR